MFTISVVNYTVDEEIFVTKVASFWRLSVAVTFCITVLVPRVPRGTGQVAAEGASRGVQAFRRDVCVSREESGESARALPAPLPRCRSARWLQELAAGTLLTVPASGRVALPALPWAWLGWSAVSCWNHNAECQKDFLRLL